MNRNKPKPKKAPNSGVVDPHASLNELLKHAVRVDNSEPIPSPWKPGDKDVCPRDGGTMVFTRDLMKLVNAEDLASGTKHGKAWVANLRGFKCQTCHELEWDGPSYEALRKVTEQAGILEHLGGTSGASRKTKTTHVRKPKPEREGGHDMLRELWENEPDHQWDNV